MAVRFTETFAGVPIGTAASLTNTTFSELVGTGTMLGVAGLFGTAVRMDSDGTTVFAGLRYNHGATAPTARWYRMYVTPRRLPVTGEGHLFLAVRSGATLNSGLRINDAGLIHLRNGATNLTGAGQITTAAVAVGATVRVEYTTDATALTQTARLYWGAGLHGTTPTETLTGPIAVAGTNMTIGSPFAVNASMDFEQVVADDAGYPPALAAVGDTENPAITMTAPAAGTTVSGTVAVSGTVSDNVGVSSVTFRVDGVARGTATVTGSNWTYQWVTTTGDVGSRVITARAVDPTGNAGLTTARTVTVEAVPDLSYLLETWGVLGSFLPAGADAAPEPAAAGFEAAYPGVYNT
jgi:hypothetical protein